MATLTSQEVELFRRIPRRTHKVGVFHTFPNSFSGKEVVTFLKTTFDMVKEVAVQCASLLTQGNVIVPLNFRMNCNFSTKSKYIYGLGPPDQQNLFWLDDMEEDDLLSDSLQMDRTTIEDDSEDESLENLKEIPEIPVLPFIGNAFAVAGPNDLNRSMCILGRELCPKYGGIFRLKLMGLHYIVISDPTLVQLVFESPSFGKKTENDPLFKELRSFRGEGLTTVSDGLLHDQSSSLISPNLAKARFAEYLPLITDTFNQCFREELGTEKRNVEFKSFLKKCTLRSVGKIAMSIDLFVGTEWKKFCEQLSFVADEAINRVYKGTKMVPLLNYKYKRAIKSMAKKLFKVIRARRKEHEVHPKDPAKYDLLDLMITVPLRVSENGHKVTMTDEMIRANLNTILSAGHSTTTSMLSWALNFLFDNSLGNTDYQYALIEEIACISGGDTRYMPTMQDIYKNLPFMTGVLKETIRLCPPIPTIIRHCLQSFNLGGYKVRKGEAIMISCLGTHLNPVSWNNPESFDPTRYEAPPPHPCSFIPWAGGPRQCIGREFALLSGRIGMFLLLNQYNLQLSPNARVRENEHLFVFPEGLLINVTARKALKQPLTPILSGKNDNASPQTAAKASNQAWEGLKALIRQTGHQVNILVGTKTEAGNSSMVGQFFIDKATEFNFKLGESPTTPDAFLPTIDRPFDSFTVIALCLSTYQGNPAPNTKKSFEWLQSLVTRLEGGESELENLLSNVRYFVFGCGNMNWATTYQKVAHFFDSNLEKLGAKRLCPIGLYDESQDDLEEELALFYKTMAPKLMHSLPEIGDKRLRAVDSSAIISKPAVQAHASSSAFQMDIIGDADEIGFPPTIPSTVVNKQIFNCPVRKIVDITPNADRSTMHIEFEMQEGMKYRAGDHLVICPVMPMEIVNRVLCRFVDYDTSTIVRWSPQFRQTHSRFHIPISTPLTIGNIFQNLLDLKASPTKQFLMNLSTIVEDASHATELQSICADLSGYRSWLKENQPISIVDIIERYPPYRQELQRLIEILPVIKPRPYSICSSSRLDASSVQVCVGVVEDTYPNGSSYHGVCSYYLKSLLGQENASVFVFVEPADENFDVPKDDNIPMIMVSAGTGFAPMRSFLQERQARCAMGEIYIFFGCRSEMQDWLYSEELKEYQATGLVTGMFVGFSRSEQFPRAYVQAKIAEQSELVWDLVENRSAYIYVCGSGTRVGVGCRDALLDIISTHSSQGTEFANDYITALESAGRYEQDVWG